MDDREATNQRMDVPADEFRAEGVRAGAAGRWPSTPVDVHSGTRTIHKQCGWTGSRVRLPRTLAGRFNSWCETCRSVLRKDGRRPARRTQMQRRLDRPSGREHPVRLGALVDAARQQRLSDVDDRSATHLSVDNVFSLLTGGSPCRTEIGECMRLVQPENTARGRACYCGWTTYPYRNVITFGVTGMSVEATECAGKYERMKFVPFVEEKRVCRHVGHSTREGPLYLGIANAGRCRCFQN